MTTEERYPNFSKLTAMLNQQAHPRNMLYKLIAIAPLDKDGKAAYNEHREGAATSG